MHIELTYTNEPGCGLCTVADLTGNKQWSKIVISPLCRNNYVSEELYNLLDHEPLQSRRTRLDYYLGLNDLTMSKSGIIKNLRLPPRYVFSEFPVIVTRSYPIYRCDMVIGEPTLSTHRLWIDFEDCLVIITDE